MKTQKILNFQKKLKIEPPSRNFLLFLLDRGVGLIAICAYDNFFQLIAGKTAFHGATT